MCELVSILLLNLCEHYGLVSLFPSISNAKRQFIYVGYVYGKLCQIAIFGETKPGPYQLTVVNHMIDRNVKDQFYH